MVTDIGVQFVLVVLAFAELSLQNPDGLVFGDDPRKPIEADADLICHSCHALVREVEANFKYGKRSAVALADIMETICAQDNFRVYDYIPPKMVKGCEAFLDAHGGDELEDALLAGASDVAVLEEKVCAELTTVCKGISYKGPAYDYNGAGKKTPTQPAKDKKKGKKKGKKKKSVKDEV